MPDSLKRDANRIPLLGGVSSIDFSTPTNAAVNPLTHAILVDATLIANQTQQAMKITVVGADTYIAFAVPGSLQADPVWQAFLIDGFSDMTLTWANGNTDYSNIATDLTLLTYS